jgi:hypothetical protein
MAFHKPLFELAYCDEDDEPSGIHVRHIEHAPFSLRDRAQRLLEEAAFRLWVGAGFAVGAFLAARYLLQPQAKIERPPE